MGLFQPRKVQTQTKKEEKFSRSQENEDRRVIFCENASIYSMNSNQAENQTLKIEHCKKIKKKLSEIIFLTVRILGGTFSLIILSIRSRSTFLIKFLFLKLFFPVYYKDFKNY